LPASRELFQITLAGHTTTQALKKTREFLRPKNVRKKIYEENLPVASAVTAAPATTAAAITPIAAASSTTTAAAMSTAPAATTTAVAAAIATASAATTSAATLPLRTRFIHHQRAPQEIFSVQSGDGLFRCGIIVNFSETESARLSRESIAKQRQ
jgi:hypothetical protein